MIQELAIRMDHLFGQFPKNKWGFLHKNSLDNFIYHLSSISDENKRAEIAEKINDYLAELESWPLIDICDSDISTSQYVYHKHVKKMFDFYDLNVSFVPVFARNASIVIIISMAGILFLFKNNKIVITILVVINIIYWGRILYKARERKIYGFGY